MRRYQTSDNNSSGRTPNQNAYQFRSGSNHIHANNTNYNNTNSRNGNNNIKGGYNDGRGMNSASRPNVTSRPMEYEHIQKPPPPPKHESILEQTAADPSGIIHSLMKFIPSGVYNRETKKLFGFLSAEDLLLVALIIMLADSDDNDDTALLIALLYIFLG